MPHFGRRRKFSPDFDFNIGGSVINTPYFSSKLNKSLILNRQCEGEKLKYVAKLFFIGGSGHEDLQGEGVWSHDLDFLGSRDVIGHVTI